MTHPQVKKEYHEKIQEFVDELSGFAQTAEDTLELIEKDKIKNKGQFRVFSERMLTIRGTAEQLDLTHIAEIAGLGEEIAIKGQKAERTSQIRKCVGSLWDALTTVKYLLQNYQEETNQEQDILVNRLKATLDSFGGARERVSTDEIEELLKNQKK